MTAARKRKIERMGRSVLANPEALHAALLRRKRKPALCKGTNRPMANQSVMGTRRCRNLAVENGYCARHRHAIEREQIATNKVIETARKLQQPAIPPTLARVERAAMTLWENYYGAKGKHYLRLFNDACAAHAAWKAKQRRGK